MDTGWKISYYTSANGENPVKKFLDSYPKAKLKALRILSHIEEYGLTYAIPHHAFIKKANKTPRREINLGLVRLSEINT